MSKLLKKLTKEIEHLDARLVEIQEKKIAIIKELHAEALAATCAQNGTCSCSSVAEINVEVIVDDGTIVVQTVLNEDCGNKIFRTIVKDGIVSSGFFE